MSGDSTYDSNLRAQFAASGTGKVMLPEVTTDENAAVGNSGTAPEQPAKSPIVGTYTITIKEATPPNPSDASGGSRRRQRRQKRKSKKRANKRSGRSRSRSRSRK